MKQPKVTRKQVSPPLQPCDAQPGPLSLETLIQMARGAAERTLARAKMIPLPRRRSARRERDWVVDLAVACVGTKGLVLYDRLAFGACYDIAERKIRIDQNLLRDGDVDFAIAHELGHWAWYELLGRERADGRDDYVGEERFANSFANALLGRGSRDFDSTSFEKEAA